MLGGLTQRLTDIVGGLRGRKITEDVIKDTSREIRRALLEADAAASQSDEPRGGAREKSSRSVRLSLKDRVGRCASNTLLQLTTAFGKQLTEVTRHRQASNALRGVIRHRQAPHT